MPTSDKFYFKSAIINFKEQSFLGNDAVINVKFTAFSINSIHINIINAFFRNIIPKNPIENKIAERVKYQSEVTSIIRITFLKLISQS